MKTNSENSFWDLKPFWCQPWTIISFGIVVIIMSWKFFSNIIITSILFFLIISWWILFLIIAPNLYHEISTKK